MNFANSAGRVPGDIRDAFLAAIEDYRGSDFLVEVGEDEMNLSELCKRLWNCAYILPGAEYRELELTGRQTYACAARHIWAELKK